MKGLQGKNVLVTGGSSGIGQAIAIRLGEEGANVAINYRKGVEEAQHTEEVIQEHVAAAVDSCMRQVKEAGVKTLLVQADVSKEDDIKRMFDEVISNVSSVHQLIPKPRFLSYSVSKGGMQNLTRTLALEYASRGIRVNGIGPGATITPINRSWVDDPVKKAQVEQHIPMRRAATSEEM